MHQDYKTRLTALSDKLTDVVLEEADPDNWPGAGKKPSELTKDERGDRYWDKNAAASLTLLIKVHSLIGMQTRGGTPSDNPVRMMKLLRWVSRFRKLSEKRPPLSSACRKEKMISFLAFFLMWAERMNWDVPDCHYQACHWLEHRGNLAVLRCFRGFGKSTILAVYNAWRYYCDRQYRILHQSESDGTAYKTSRDTQNVLRNHPLTKGMLPDGQGTVEQWWVNGALDIRNGSMYAKGILSNVTSARANECQNDDVGTPQYPDARGARKTALSPGRTNHILIPGGRKLYIGTPHTHDSLYDEVESMGADCLTIRLFEKEKRIEAKDATQLRYELSFRPEYVFAGIHKAARLLVEDVDYKITADGVEFASRRTLLSIFMQIAPGLSDSPAKKWRTAAKKRARLTNGTASTSCTVNPLATFVSILTVSVNTTSSRRSAMRTVRPRSGWVTCKSLVLSPGGMWPQAKLRLMPRRSL
jgi:hypothetical protein